jgi:hypothetical protein
MKHIHAELMLQYAQDAQHTDKPFDLWQACDPQATHPHNGWWYTLKSDPAWNPAFQYRRKPQEHTVTLNTEQLRRILEACDYPDWENGDFVTGVAVLKAALGIPTKTNTQIIEDLLNQAHEQLEEISAEICALNLDGIQDLLAQVRELVKGDVK